MYEGALGHEYADGEAICRQGEPGDRMFIVQSGRVIVEVASGTGAVFVTELKGGDIFGEMALVERRPRSATVRAHGPVRVLTLDKRAFLRQVHEDPSLAYRILETMSRRIRRLDAELSEYRRIRSQDTGVT
jgi:CRP-like cAMP-binding protein